MTAVLQTRLADLIGHNVRCVDQLLRSVHTEPVTTPGGVTHDPGELAAALHSGDACGGGDTTGSQFVDEVTRKLASRAGMAARRGSRRSLPAEPERRVGGTSAFPARTLHARRGQVARAVLNELADSA